MKNLEMENLENKGNDIVDEKPRKLWDVYIEEKLWPVLRLPCKHMSLNNGDPHYWLFMGDIEKNVSHIVDGSWKPWESGNWKMEHERLGFYPYEETVIPRSVWSVTYAQEVVTKRKWGSTDFRIIGVCEIFRNGMKFYEFGARDYNYAVAKAEVMKVELSEHPFNFYEPRKEDGRKIWFRGLPATIQTGTHYPWEISVYPDVEGWAAEIPSGIEAIEHWWRLYEDREMETEQSNENKSMTMQDMAERKEFGFINWGDAFADQYINWFRT